MVAASPGPGAATSSGTTPGGAAPVMVSNSTPSASTSDLPARLPDDRDRDALDHGDDDAPRPAAGHLDRGDLRQPGDPRLDVLDVDPQERGARPRCRPPSAPPRRTSVPAPSTWTVPTARSGPAHRNQSAAASSSTAAASRSDRRRRERGRAGRRRRARGVTGAEGRRSGVRRRLPVRSRVVVPVRLIGARPPGRPFRRPTLVAAQDLEHLRPHHRHVTGAHGHHQVAGPGPRRQGGRGRRPGGLEQHAAGGQRHRVGDHRAGHARHRVLAGPVDVHDHDLVGQPEGAAEPVGELQGAAVEVRLEGHHQPAAAGHGAGGAQLRADLGGVVGVVVVDADAADHALELEPAVHAAEPGQAVDQSLGRQPQLQTGQQRRGAVERHVLARAAGSGPARGRGRRGSRCSWCRPAPPRGRAAAGRRPRASAVGAQPRLRRDAAQPGGARVVGADDDEAVGVHGPEEPVEGGLDGGEVAVVVQVVGLDVGHDPGERARAAGTTGRSRRPRRRRRPPPPRARCCPTR